MRTSIKLLGLVCGAGLLLNGCAAEDNMSTTPGTTSSTTTTTTTGAGATYAPGLNNSPDHGGNTGSGMGNMGGHP